MEGDSAGGSAKQGRDRRFQAIPPLRGKILNIEKTDDAIYKNTEIQALITALGLGIKGEDFDVKNPLPPGRDHDRRHVDGAYIHPAPHLLLPLPEGAGGGGYIYIACPPLYKVERGKNHTYCYNEGDLQKTLEGGEKANYRSSALRVLAK